ncbi:putative NADH-dependent fumarate reductase [Leptomonas pyrrhocoris]|uniref:fumarate reductase (NADH) n=1 Tax=Leptomonas pyrrhocoris TaxID=157538 RepID=A0A0N0VHR8_LEPPY|nr:putative NADH-dependent fumarate reductase [Leptomonas pyrrhocoris]XP_015664453.1 putative NADH-dependent fumarate reductase [Leptomonas pyrrhocoris]KPA86013.1 putative NADH-dependent fumarate reductase [Leptomonas pyrrhocoris]KPA86014.1 putative NADH-dependent fumarate reductase [Leptomonas pyrrhocoris]|eukprot:XP_015664452.1 putative NADH-dependent fumarate reductase [Leptomonas pyrrhocoris]
MSRAASNIGRVVIIGSGLAGQSAAIQAARDGVREVVILEKEPRMGGNSAKATSGINGWGTRVQKAAGIQDSGELFENDTFVSGKGGHCQPALVKTLSDHSAEAVEWLSAFDIPLTVLSQLGGASRKRCHRTPDKLDGTPMPVGFTIVKTLENYIRTYLSDKVRIETNTRLTSLLREQGGSSPAVRGVSYAQKNEAGEERTHELLADAVILATGGFSNDHTNNSLLQEYAPQLSSFPTTNGVWATGDGVKAARELGVALIDMDKVQLHPTGLINPKDPSAKTVFLGPEALRGSGGILLNKKGERFVNELDLRSVVSQAIIAQNNVYPGSENRRYAYCVMNEAAADAFGRSSLNFYWKKMGLFSEAADVAAMADLIGCSVETLTNTLNEYEKLSADGQRPCPRTGKKVFPNVLGAKGPFYVAYVTPSIHYTMGGCLISASAEILNEQLVPIRGLYGAGEVTGGVHGGNRLGGNSLLECVVFGRIAGSAVAKHTAAPTA